MATVGQLAAKLANPQKNVLADAGNDLFHQVQEHAKAAQGEAAGAAQGEAAGAAPEVAPNYTVKAVPKDAQGEPLVSEANIVQAGGGRGVGRPHEVAARRFPDRGSGAR